MVTTDHLNSQDADRPPTQVPAPELSVVMPCLNEAATLEACIQKIRRVLSSNNIQGEIIVADNGSTDTSRTIAERLGARVIPVETRGYGSALKGGISAALGKYVIMGDADDSYDFAQIPLFLEKLRSGFDLVVGNRFKGGIRPGAMRPLHRYFGVPLLSRFARLLFDSPVRDNHCGLRGFRKASFTEMGLRATSWEFGSEMILKANLLGMRVAEVPTTLSPDGRGRPPHLRTWEAGWRHLRLMLLYSPRWLFLYPGVVLMLVGLFTGLWLMPGPRSIGKVTFNVHTLLYSATAILVGFQAVVFSVFTKILAIRQGLLPPDPRLDRLVRSFKLETGLLIGVAFGLLGLAGSLYAVGSWGAQHFGPLESSKGLRAVIPSVLSLMLGGQVILSSFFLSVLKMGEK